MRAYLSAFALALLLPVQAVRAMGITIVLGIFAAMYSTDATAQGKIALIIGNANYPNIGQLQNPTNDADLIAATLRHLGFKLIGNAAKHNLTLSQFSSAIHSFSAQAATADVAIVYYAGHGVQLNGVNYLLPVDLPAVNGPSDITGGSIDAAVVLDALDKANIRLKILVLDACRNNPWESRGIVIKGSRAGLADLTRGLSSMSAPTGTVIWYATQPGAVADDGTGNNGPFALALVKTITVPGRNIFDEFNALGVEVMRVTNNHQQPWLAASALPPPPFYFVPLAAEHTIGAASLGPQQGAPAPEMSLAAARTDDARDAAAETSKKEAALAADRTDNLGTSSPHFQFSSSSPAPQSPFATGIATPYGHDYVFGQTYSQVNQALDSHFSTASWADLPKSVVYGEADVRYLRVPLTGLPTVSSVLASYEDSKSYCIDPESQVYFYFKHEELTRIVLHLHKGAGCPSYDGILKGIFTGKKLSTILHTADGDTLVNAVTDKSWTEITIDRIETIAKTESSG